VNQRDWTRHVGERGETSRQNCAARYQAFETEVSLLAKQKITIKTDLLPTSVSQAGASAKPE